MIISILIARPLRLVFSNEHNKTCSTPNTRLIPKYSRNTLTNHRQVILAILAETNY